MKMNVMIRESRDPSSPRRDIASADDVVRRVVTALCPETVYTMTNATQHTTICVIDSAAPAEISAISTAVRQVADIRILIPAMSIVDLECAGFRKISRLRVESAMIPAPDLVPLPQAACA